MTEDVWTIHCTPVYQICLNVKHFCNADSKVDAEYILKIVQTKDKPHIMARGLDGQLLDKTDPPKE